MHNPFYHRGALRREEDFFGRSTETEQILGLLRNGQSVSLIGPRRIGKSSLLLHLCREAVRERAGLGTDDALFVIIDSQELGGSPAEEVYEVLLDGLSQAAQEAGLEIDWRGTDGTYRSLDRALNRIVRNDKVVVVLLDEFELLAANQHLSPYFFARLRGLTTKYGLAFLTASQRPLFAITASEEILSSPFFNIFVSIALGEFSKEEATDLLQSRLAGHEPQFKSDTRAFIMDLAGNHPFFLHIAGYHAYQQMLQGEAPDYDLLNKAIEMETESHLGYLWHNLSEAERYALAILDGPVDIMRALEQQCLVQPQSEDTSYRFTSRLLQRFVRRQEVAGLVQAAPFVVDPQRHTVVADGSLLDLTISQFELFLRLAKEAGHVVPSADLECAVWGEALVDDPDRLKTLIKRLRRAIEPYDNWIVSERGVGYALRRPD